MLRRLSKSAGLTLLAALLLAPSASADTRVYVRVGPPPVVAERVGRPPHPGYVWQPGYHRYHGGGYVWVRGGWARPPHAHSTWVSGRWEHEHRGYYWVPGHWSHR
jgi:hypothetical protein